MLTVSLYAEVDEPEGAGDDKGEADEQGPLGVVGHPAPQAVKEVVGRVVDPAVESRPCGARLRTICTFS